MVVNSFGYLVHSTGTGVDDLGYLAPPPSSQRVPFGARFWISSPFYGCSSVMEDFGYLAPATVLMLCFYGYDYVFDDVGYLAPI